MTSLAGDTAGARLAVTILMTLPGVPFIYYGEEIGMTGDKPDERLRTPMQWTATSSGFTSGKPWEPAQADTLQVNVAAEERQANSLLELYRWLIRLRANDAAVQRGTLEPVATGNDAVIAYERSEGKGRVLVIANLGKTAATLAFRGRFAYRSLLAPGKTRSALPTLAPRTAYIYEITQRP